MKINPFHQFKEWFRQQLEATNAKLPGACCLSTIDLDNFPNARFVSLKEVTETGFIITGSVTSQKGVEIQNNHKVALTFWWSDTERQIRIQGEASRISDQLAGRYFSERNRDSQIVSVVSEQGADLTDLEQLQRKYDLLDNESQTIERPRNWGGYLIVPKRIEFLEFKQTRFHDRALFQIINGEWTLKKLQP